MHEKMSRFTHKKSNLKYKKISSLYPSDQEQLTSLNTLLSRLGETGMLRNCWWANWTTPYDRGIRKHLEQPTGKNL